MDVQKSISQNINSYEINIKNIDGNHCIAFINQHLRSS